MTAKHWGLVVAILVVSFLTHIPALIEPSVISGPDVRIHYQWAIQFAASLSEGVIYPRWASFSYLGLGDPTFLYIHPLFYYTVAVIQTLTRETWTALLWTSVIATSLASLLSYFALRHAIGEWLAVITAILISLSPYTFHLTYYQQFLPMSFALPALVGYLATLVLPSGKRRILLVAITVGLLVVSHILTAFMALLVSGPVVLTRAARSQRSEAVRILLDYGVGVALGLGLVGIYLFPALTSQTLITPEGWYAPVHLDWRNAFLFQALTLPSFGFRWFHLQWSIPLITLFFILFSSAALWKTRQVKDFRWWLGSELVAIATLALLLGSEVTYPLWANLEIFKRLQFPLRLLGIASPAAIMGFGVACSLLNQARSGRWAKTGVFTALALSIVMLGTLEYRFTQEAHPVAEIAKPSRIYKGRPEMKPATAGHAWNDYVQQGGFVEECRTLAVECQFIREDTHDKAWQIRSDQDAPIRLRLPLFWFPGWEVVINGVLTPGRWDEQTGLLTVDVDKGTTVMEARWVGIRAERIGLGISLIALGIFLAMAASGFIRDRR